MLNQGIGSWIFRRRQKSAGAIALIFNEKATGYTELIERIDRLANALHDRGVGKGDRVAYFGENHTAFLETLFAAGTLGAIFVPLNARLAGPEVNYALSDSGSIVLVHPESLAHVAVAAVGGTEVTHRIVVSDAAFAAPATAPVGTLDAETARASAGIPVEQFDDVIAGASPEHVDVEVTLSDPAIILYTSGTTGMPKGALLTHGNITWNCFNVLVDYDFASTDVALMISPMFHVASLNMGVLPTLLKGGTVVLEPRFDPARVLWAIQNYKATIISGVPTTFQMLCEHPDWESTDISSLQKLTCGGSAVPLRVTEAYEKRGLSFSGGYGMTETAPGVTSLAPAKSREKAGSAGLPHFFTNMRIVDDKGEPVGPGVVGEIQVKGGNVIRHYWNRPEATSEAFSDDVWFRSGDLGSVDEEGYLYISDRLKDMIISGGENIYPAQVEQIILELEEVGDVALIGVPDERWGEVPLAVVALREGRSITGEEIRAHLEGKVARYKLPKSVVFVDELPRTASGKVRKADLRAQFGG